MRFTISLLTLPTRTISTTSMVSSSVTRMPSTNCDSFPSCFRTAPIWGPPPWTITGLMPMNFIRTMSRAKDFFERVVHHGVAAVLDDDGLVVEPPDVRQRLKQNLARSWAPVPFLSCQNSQISDSGYDHVRIEVRGTRIEDFFCTSDLDPQTSIILKGCSCSDPRPRRYSASLSLTYSASMTISLFPCPAHQRRFPPAASP